MTNVAGRTVHALWRHVSMRRIILTYAGLGIVIAVLSVFREGIWAGVCALCAPLLLTAAAGGMKAMFFWGSRNQKIFGVVAALIVGTIAVRMAPAFSVHAFGYSFGGPAWSAIGGFLGLLASRRANWDAGSILDGNKAPSPAPSAPAR